MISYLTFPFLLYLRAPFILRKMFLSVKSIFFVKKTFVKNIISDICMTQNCFCLYVLAYSEVRNICIVIKNINRNHITI